MQICNNYTVELIDTFDVIYPIMLEVAIYCHNFFIMQQNINNKGPPDNTIKNYCLFVENELFK